MHKVDLTEHEEFNYIKISILWNISVLCFKTFDVLYYYFTSTCMMVFKEFDSYSKLSLCSELITQSTEVV